MTGTAGKVTKVKKHLLGEGKTMEASRKMWSEYLRRYSYPKVGKG